MPADGKAKGGTPESRVGQWLQRLNESEGPAIEFTGKCDRYPNTTGYHIAMAHVLDQHGKEAQHAFSSRVFRAYYKDGIYPSNDNLVGLAAEVVDAIDRGALKSTLEDPAAAARVVGRARSLAADHGVTGVPFFLINGKPAFSGAQEPEAFARAIATA